MDIVLENLQRSFGRQKVISDLNYRFETGQSYAILGGNGSGKSTLLRLIQGSLTPTSGKVSYFDGTQSISRDDVAFRINLAGPYLELIEELTANEFLVFFQKFRRYYDGYSPRNILDQCRLSNSADKQIRNFSSGMRQRLRLGLALFTMSDVVMLDEPTSNLDPSGVEWYRNLVQDNIKDRTLLIGSNFSKSEMDFCQHELTIDTSTGDKD